MDLWWHFLLGLSVARSVAGHLVISSASAGFKCSSICTAGRMTLGV
jgi:hypothetical protein